MNHDLLRIDWRQASYRMTHSGENSFHDLKFIGFPAADRSRDVANERQIIRSLLVPASVIERGAARMNALRVQRDAKQETKQRQEALSTWEDEGGSSTRPIRPVAP